MSFCNREVQLMNEAINSQDFQSNPVDNPSDGDAQVDDPVDDSIVTLVDDEGRMSEFEVLDAIETQDGRFVALFPLASINEETGEGEYIILSVVNVDGEEELAEIDDEELLEAVADVFQERFQGLYESGDV